MLTTSTSLKELPVFDGTDYVEWSVEFKAKLAIAGYKKFFTEASPPVTSTAVEIAEWDESSGIAAAYLSLALARSLWQREG
jgi:hypothetical protein